MEKKENQGVVRIRNRGILYFLPFAGSLIFLISCGGEALVNENEAESTIIKQENPKKPKKIVVKVDPLEEIKRLQSSVESQWEKDSNAAKKTLENFELLSREANKQAKRNTKIAKRQLKGAKALDELNNSKNLTPERRASLMALAKESLDPISLDEPVNLLATLLSKERFLVAERAKNDRELAILRITYSDLDAVKLTLLEAKLSSDKLDLIEDQIQDQIHRIEIAKDDLNEASKNNWRIGKEVALYLFTLKWVWGIFTGYATSTSTSDQAAELAKVEAEASQKIKELQTERAILLAKQRVQLRALKLGFDKAARRQPNLIRSLRLTALKERVIQFFEEHARQRDNLRAAEKIYTESIRVGLLEPLEPAVKQKWRIDGITFDGSFSGGYTNEIRLKRAFTYKGIFEPRANWTLETFYKVGGGWRDELRSFRRVQYEQALQRAGLARLNLDEVVSAITQISKRPQKKTDSISGITSSQLSQTQAEAALQTPKSIKTDPNKKQESTLEGQAKLLRESIDAAFRGDVSKAILELEQRQEELNQELVKIRLSIAEVEDSDNQLMERVVKARAKNVDKIFTKEQKRYAEIANEAKELVKVGKASEFLLAKLERLRREVILLKQAADALEGYKESYERDKDLLKIRKLGQEQASRYNWRLAKELTLYLFGFKWFWGIFTGFQPTSDTSTEDRLVRESEAVVKDLEQRHELELAKLEQQLQRAKYRVSRSVEEAVSAAVDPFAKLALQDFKRQLDTSFVALDFAKDRYKAQAGVYLAALESGTKRYSPSSQTEYARVDQIKPVRANGQPNLQPSHSADWEILKREQVSEVFYQAQSEFEVAKSNFESYFGAKLETLLLNIVNSVEAKRKLFREKLEEMKRIEGEVELLANDIGKKLDLYLLPQGKQVGFLIPSLTPAEISWGSYGEENKEVGLSLEEENQDIVSLNSIPQIARRISQAASLIEVGNIEEQLLPAALSKFLAEEKIRKEINELVEGRRPELPAPTEAELRKLLVDDAIRRADAIVEKEVIETNVANPVQLDGEELERIREDISQQLNFQQPGAAASKDELARLRARLIKEITYLTGQLTKPLSEQNSSMDESEDEEEILTMGQRLLLQDLLNQFAELTPPSEETQQPGLDARQLALLKEIAGKFTNVSLREKRELASEIEAILDNFVKTSGIDIEEEADEIDQIKREDALENEQLATLPDLAKPEDDSDVEAVEESDLDNLDQKQTEDLEPVKVEEESTSEDSRTEEGGDAAKEEADAKEDSEDSSTSEEVQDQADQDQSSYEETKQDEEGEEEKRQDSDEVEDNKDNSDYYDFGEGDDSQVEEDSDEGDSEKEESQANDDEDTNEGS